MRIVVRPRLHDRAGRGIAGHFDIGEPDVMRSSIDPLDDRIGRAFQFVMQSALDQAAEHGIGRLVAVQGKAGDIRLAADDRSSPDAWS